MNFRMIEPKSNKYFRMIKSEAWMAFQLRACLVLFWLFSDDKTEISFDFPDNKTETFLTFQMIKPKSRTDFRMIKPKHFWLSDDKSEIFFDFSDDKTGIYCSEDGLDFLDNTPNTVTGAVLNFPEKVRQSLLLNFDFLLFSDDIDRYSNYMIQPMAWRNGGWIVFAFAFGFENS